MGAGSSAEANRLSSSPKCSSTLELFDMHSISLSEQIGIAPLQLSKGAEPHAMLNVAEEVSSNQTLSCLPASLTANRRSRAIEAAALSRNDREVSAMRAHEERNGLPVKMRPDARSRVKGRRLKAEHPRHLSRRPLRTPLPNCVAMADRQRIDIHPGQSRKGQHCSLSSCSALLADASATVEEKRKEKTSQPQRLRQSKKETEGLLPRLPGKREERKGTAGVGDEVPWTTRQTSRHPSLEPQSGSASHSTVLPVFAPTAMPTLQQLAATITWSSEDSRPYFLFAGSDQNVSTVSLEDELQSCIDDGCYGTHLVDMKPESPMMAVAEAEATPELQQVFAPQPTAAQGESLSAGSESDVSSLRPLRVKRPSSLLSKRSRRGSFVSFGGEVRLA